MIYYIDANGKIIGGTHGETPDALQGITAIPSSATHAVYVSDVDHPEVQQDMADYTLTINPDETITVTHTPVADSVKLANAQAVKQAELEAGLIATIEGGFNSDAVTSGTMLTYGFADSDQTNMSQELNIINAGVAVEPIEWGLKDGTVVDHTAAQFKTVCATGNQFKWAQVKQFRTLLAQVKAATTVDAVNAIVWTPANY